MSYFTRTENPDRPTIVVLCGSTRFGEAFRRANLDETLAGRIVLSIGCDMRSDADLFAHLDDDAIKKIKSDLDELHLRKIDLADEVLILNVGGYVGLSTRQEIGYARASGKLIRWLEPPAAVPAVPAATMDVSAGSGLSGAGALDRATDSEGEPSTLDTSAVPAETPTTEVVDHE